jgi:CheY-like chemotaxis protein
MARKVLLADDSIAVQRAVEATLEPKDFEVLSVSRGSEVLLEAKKLHPDVILVDGDLSDVDGYEICRRVKGDPELMSVPVIIMTSGDDPERARSAGAEAQLAKPFQGNDLLQQVLAVVDMTAEPTIKLDTSEMEVLDTGDEASEEDFDLGELELEDSILELTEELDESPSPLADTAEVSLEGLDELDLEGPPEPAAGRRSIKTEELEEISFEEEIDELDLGELELEGAEGLGSLEEDLEPGGAKDNLLATDEVELGVDLDEELPLGQEDEGKEEFLLGTEEEPTGLILDTQEGLKGEAASESIIDTDELEALGLEEEERLISTAEETPAPGELEETSIEFQETEQLEETTLAEQEGITGTGEALGELAMEPLEEPSIDWEEKEGGTELAGESLAPSETPLGAQPVKEEAGEKEQVSLEVQGGLRELRERGAAGKAAAVMPPVPEGVVPHVATAVLEPLEEVGLEEELAVLGASDEEIGPQGVEILEVSLAQVPPLVQGLRLELMEEDFGVVDPFSEEGIRRELARNLQEIVERVLSQMAPPIVERVARAVALDYAERIVLEEIERIKKSPERL